MSFSLIPTALAATATTSSPPTGAANALSTFLLLLGFLLIFYFFVIRPQTKRAKELRELIANLREGDEVITNGGIIGKVVKLTDEYIVLAIADTVHINLQKNAVAAVLPKGTMKSVE